VFRKKEDEFKYSQSHKAARQLLTHLLNLNRELNLGFDWIAPSRDPNWLQGSNWRKLQTCWVKLCVVFPDYSDGPLDKVKFGNLAEKTLGVGSSNVHFLTRNDVGAFSAQLEAWLASSGAASEPGLLLSSEGMNRARQTYQKVSMWCLLHTFGMILSQRSRLIDEEHSRVLTSGAGEPSTLSSWKTPIALLTARQLFILANEHNKEKPVLIVGSAGTGKTFLLLGKLKQLKENNLLHDEAKALVIIEHGQVCLHTILKGQLAIFGAAVILRTYKYGRGKKLRGVLDVLKREGELVKYLFVDQLEDFIDQNTKVLQELERFHQYCCEHRQLQLMWFMWNARAGFEHDGAHVPNILDETDADQGKGGFMFHVTANTDYSCESWASALSSFASTNS
jgi:hypothetical protein